MASSSAPDGFRYDVFLSFRGKDTRKAFTSHLRAALDREQIKTYIDYELKSGEEIGPALRKAIEESKLSVVILSQNYASSTWCLNELAHIIECKERYQQLVIPIFYEVDPSHVRHQSESYEAAFVQHEQHYTPDKVRKWRDALTIASNLAGFDSHSFGQESELVEGVVKVVEDNVMKLNRECSSDLKGLVGIESHITLCIAPQDVGFSSSQLMNWKELDISVAEDECLNCGGIGHWAKDCPLAGDEDITVAEDECFRCGRPGHWAKDCLSAGDQDMYGRKTGREAYSSSGWSNYGEGDRSSVGRNECFRCGSPGHWAKDCLSAGDQDMYGRKMGREAYSSSGWSNYGEGDRSSVGRNECFKCGRPGHWARDCPSATDQVMHGSGQAGGDDSNTDYIVYSYGGRRSPRTLAAKVPFISKWWRWK